MEARAREDELRAAASRRVGDEAARRMTEQRLIEEARRDGRREGRRETRRSNVTLVVNERPKSGMVSIHGTDNQNLSRAIATVICFSKIPIRY